MRETTRAILEAGRAWRTAQAAWSVAERIEARHGFGTQVMEKTATLATTKAEDAIDAALIAGAGVAALLLQGIPAAAIAAGLSRQKGE